MDQNLRGSPGPPACAVSAVPSPPDGSRASCPASAPRRPTPTTVSSPPSPPPALTTRRHEHRTRLPLGAGRFLGSATWWRVLRFTAAPLGARDRTGGLRTLNVGPVAGARPLASGNSPGRL